NPSRGVRSVPQQELPLPPGEGRGEGESIAQFFLSPCNPSRSRRHSSCEEVGDESIESARDIGIGGSFRGRASERLKSRAGERGVRALPLAGGGLARSKHARAEGGYLFQDDRGGLRCDRDLLRRSSKRDDGDDV